MGGRWRLSAIGMRRRRDAVRSSDAAAMVVQWTSRGVVLCCLRARVGVEWRRLDDRVSDGQTAGAVSGLDGVSECSAMVVSGVSPRGWLVT